MKAFVTGATGCVGANVVAALVEKGYAVRAMRRESSRLDALEGLAVELVTGDLMDRASLERAMDGCAWVFHVAAISDYWRTPTERIYHVNVTGTRHVLAAAAAVGVERLVYTSSVGALGVPENGRWLTEADTFNLPEGRFPYGHSKHLAEEAVRAAVAAGLDAVVVNPAVAIGPRDVHWIGGSLLREAQRGGTWFAPPGGTCWASAVAIGRGHVLAAERGRTGERYILGGDNLTHRRAFEIVVQIVGGRAPRVVLPGFLTSLVETGLRGLQRIPGLALPFSGEQVWLGAREIYCDSTKAVRDVGYELVSFEDAVEEAYRWYRERGWMA
ncbi:MAG: NAD-dependent epimerase/dehydratase family protein [Anaerolineae bacterium]|nr:NAD-dependent epimerase/dehydratase family protein [Anaerolineae bacterium]